MSSFGGDGVGDGGVGGIVCEGAKTWGVIRTSCRNATPIRDLDPYAARNPTQPVNKNLGICRL